ncbi:dephospho-CoA kinase [Roseimicrobium gellanilyticum]|uniref:Dephospho-CoA kinase n=1 Tax=Roseimicrobium gellanilyticum TaxID=748857 RepID=A0A366HPC0_9BACT|nr:dephospho-CoA kinase [Roseimicrobium gellanilyticum]RBP45337.1 dephospho-CoA kinase [Roseimicrobium gellanilyticum]
MKTWIVTGGAASGKSTFARLLDEQADSAVLFSSDGVVHELLGRPEVVEKLAGAFGPEIVGAKGAIDRGKLREIVFKDGNEERRKALEAILHPLVREELGKLREDAGAKKAQLLIAEVPLFYESAYDYQADLVIVVAVGNSVQMERLTGQRGLDKATAERICAAQWPLSRKLDAADKVIWNEGSAELLKLQAQLLLQQLDTENGK